MPLADDVAQVVQLLKTGRHSRGEMLVARDRARRWAEHDGRYEATYAAMNPD